MSDQVVSGARDLVPCVVISCLNLIVALTLVAISLLLVMAVSAIACFLIVLRGFNQSVVVSSRPAAYQSRGVIPAGIAIARNDRSANVRLR